MVSHEYQSHNVSFQWVLNGWICNFHIFQSKHQFMPRVNRKHTASWEETGNYFSRLFYGSTMQTAGILRKNVSKTKRDQMRQPHSFISMGKTDWLLWVTIPLLLQFDAMLLSVPLGCRQIEHNHHRHSGCCQLLNLGAEWGLSWAPYTQ